METNEMADKICEYACKYIADTYCITEEMSDITLRFLFGDDKGFANASLQDIAELVDNCVTGLVMPIIKEATDPQDIHAWHEVKLGPPPPDSYILMATDKYCTFDGYYSDTDDNGEYEYHLTNGLVVEPTYWMTLPKMPYRTRNNE